MGHSFLMIEGGLRGRPQVRASRNKNAILDLKDEGQPTSPSPWGSRHVPSNHLSPQKRCLGYVELHGKSKVPQYNAELQRSGLYSSSSAPTAAVAPPSQDLCCSAECASLSNTRSAASMWCVVAETSDEGAYMVGASEDIMC